MYFKKDTLQVHVYLSFDIEIIGKKNNLKVESKIGSFIKTKEKRINKKFKRNFENG